MKVILTMTACFILTVPTLGKTIENKILSEQLKQEIIDSVTTCFKRDYVSLDLAQEMSQHLYDRFANGAYAGIRSLEEFFDSLTVDMRSISEDRHINIYYRPDAYFESETQDDSIEEGWQVGLDQKRYFNFDFEKVERLLGNIGYLKFHQFRDVGEAGLTARAALNFLAYSDAIIIDLRRNGGGDPAMVQFISSYFFDEPRHLNSFYVRRDDSTQEFWTKAEVEGPRMSDVDIYILISRYTFSAAEEFAYNLKHMGRATLVGGITGGGAHHSEFIKMRHLNMELKVPYARAVNPITGTNWEGVGVKPDIEAFYGKSFNVAYLEAVKGVRAKETNVFKVERLDWVIMGLQAKLNPITIDEEILEGYVAKYGDYDISLNEGVLYIQQGGYTKVELKPLSETVFQWGDLDYLRIEFRKDQGKPTNSLYALDIDDGAVFLGGRTE